MMGFDMLKRFLPRQEGFFERFQAQAALLMQASQQFGRLLHDLPNAVAIAHEIGVFEEQADAIANANFALLHKTFITPFDRHDIHQLTSGLDDVMDLINRCAQRFTWYKLTAVPRELTALADRVPQVVTWLKTAVGHLHSLKESDAILNACQAIDSIEGQAEQDLMVGLAKLFEEENDFKQLLKLKALYEQIKSVLNLCQDVANHIKGIVLEYA